ncbi:MAG: FxsA family protein [Firmicutes bacterium]|nr:FxsA family protein [Bacillota bacterium]
MLFKVLLVLFLVPMVEALLLFSLARLYGVAFSMASLVTSGLVGLLLIRTQGGQSWQEIRDDLWEGHLPDAEVISRLLIFLAGLLLLIPGPLTDLVGVLLLVPVVRRMMVKLSRGYLEHLMQQGQIRLYQWHS